MPIATPEIYADMLDRAKKGAFAYPAINVSSSQTLTAAIRGFAEAERYKETYWSRFKGIYFAGDGAKLDKDGAIWLLQHCYC